MVLPVNALALRSAVIVPDAITPLEAARARPTAYTRYTLIDRGSYGFVENPDEPALLARARELAGGLTITRARILRLDPGDYLLARHDDVIERGIEVVIDLSPAAVPGAEVHYRQHGQVLFVMPSTPCSAAIVPRTASVTANHTYISRRGTAPVVRLVVTLV